MTDHSTVKEQVAEFYEQHHSRGKYDYLYGDEGRKDTLVRLVGRGRRVLDVGCRSGNFTQHYCHGNEVIGVDIDRKALDLFRERLGLEGHWLDVDCEPLPFPSASFDVVVFTEVMEHLRFPRWALAEIRRVLKAEGQLVGSAPNAFRLRSRWRFLWGRPYETDPSHLRSYSAPTLREALSAEFHTAEVTPVSGHLLGGGRHGVPVESPESKVSPGQGDLMNWPPATRSEGWDWTSRTRKPMPRRAGGTTGTCGMATRL